ncbi:hypothetical protein ACOSQ2_024068 [Xanthoceras sorbifolium]
MTTEKTEYWYIPETVQLKDNHKRRYSTGKIGYVDGGVNIVSRYLRPSMGSCHDFCKYGVEHALEIKARGPMPMLKRIMATQSESQEVEKTVTSAERAKKLTVNIKPSPGSHTQSQKLDDPVVKEQVSLPLKRSNDPIEREVSSLAKEEDVSTDIKVIDVYVEDASDLIDKETCSSSQVLTPFKEEDATDPFIDKQFSSLSNKEASSSSQGLPSIKEVDVYMKHSNEPIDKEVDISMKYASDLINQEVSSLAYEEDILSTQVLIPTKEEDVLTEHGSDPFNREVFLSSTDKEAMKHANEPIDKEVSSLTNKEAISSKQVSTPLEVDVLMKHASDPINKQVSSSANKDANSSRQGLTSIKEVDVYMKHANRVDSSLAKKEAILPRQVSTPLKEVDVFMKHLGGPKLKKPMKSNVSRTVAMQKCSNNQGDRKVRKSKQMEELQMNSPGVSTVKRKSEKTSNEMRSSIRAERRVSVPPAVSLSTKHSVKRPSSRNVEKSSNLNGVSHLSNQKTIKKPKHERCNRRDVPEKTLPAVELKSERKTLRPVKNNICTTDLSSSSSSFLGNRSLKRANHGIRTAELPLSSVKRNLRRTQAKVHTPQSPQSWSPSLKKKVVRSIQLGTYVAGPTSSSLASSSAKNGVSSDDNEMETENGILYLKKENNSRSRNNGTLSSKDKSDPGKKLTFRRGKVVQLEQEDNTPRRLNFKRRLPVGNQNIEGDASRELTFAKKEEGDASRVLLTVAKKEADSKEVSVTKPESKKVVLRCRDVKGERNSLSLCNNVIEETVSKLVKTRTSKVKALVGAFESLISYQDTKPTLVTAGAS